MWQELVNLIKEQLASNDFLAGGVVIALGAAAFQYFRYLPKALMAFARWLCVKQVDIPDRTVTFLWVTNWVSTHSYMKSARRISVEVDYNKGKREDSRTISISPAPGWHLLWWDKRPLILRRVRNEGTDDNANRPFRESWAITTFGQDITKFIQYCQSIYYEEAAKYINVFTGSDGCWYGPNRKRKRAIESVILQDQLREKLLADVHQFMQSEEWYVDKGIPWRRGYLLYGPPGNGKSSLISAVASEVDLSIHIINLNSCAEEDLTACMLNLPPNTILLMEDVDCAWEGRDTEGGISFSNLLNLLDGVPATDGRLVFMTTNHLDKLDPALIRPGRVDYKLELKNADRSQIKRMYERFYPNVKGQEAFVDAVEKIGPSMASLQGYLLKYKDSPADANYNLKELEYEVQSYQQGLSGANAGSE